MTTILAPFADTHPNSRVALMPPKVELEGGEYGIITVKASKAQKALWKAWTAHWRNMAELKERLGAKLVAVQVGDGSDDNKHGKASLISANKADIVKLAVTTLEPVLEVADQLFVVRGTEAHAGEGCWQEELVAKIVGAEPDEEAKTHSWWWLPMVAEGVTFHLAHHPPARSWVPYLRQTAASRSAAYLAHDYMQRGEKVPDVAVYGHVHYLADGGRAVKPHTVFLPGWQLTTSFAHRLGKAGMTQPVGAAWFVCEDGAYTFDYRLWHTKGKRPWRTS